MILPFTLLPIIAYENENKNVFLWNILLCAISMLAMLVVGRIRHRLSFLYSLLALFGSSFLLATYLTDLFSLFSFPISKVVRWKGRKYQYVRQESSSKDRISPSSIELNYLE
jgi:predicted membrane protein